MQQFSLRCRAQQSWVHKFSPLFRTPQYGYTNDRRCSRHVTERIRQSTSQSRHCTCGLTADSAKYLCCSNAIEHATLHKTFRITLCPKAFINRRLSSPANGAGAPASTGPTFAHCYFFTFFILGLLAQITSFQTSGGVPGEDFDV